MNKFAKELDQIWTKSQFHSLICFSAVSSGIGFLCLRYLGYLITSDELYMSDAYTSISIITLSILLGLRCHSPEIQLDTKIPFIKGNIIIPYSVSKLSAFNSLIRTLALCTWVCSISLNSFWRFSKTWDCYSASTLSGCTCASSCAISSTLNKWAISCLLISNSQDSSLFSLDSGKRLREWVQLQRLWHRRCD